jgi:hypothetical protein
VGEPEGREGEARGGGGGEPSLRGGEWLGCKGGGRRGRGEGRKDEDGRIEMGIGMVGGRGG